MSLNRQLKLMLWRLLFFSIPMFVLWWNLQQSLLMPALINIENALLGAVYKQEQAQVVLKDIKTIDIATGLISQDNNNRAAKKNSRFALHIHVPVNPNMTLGLATVWGLLLAVPYRRLRNICLATILLIPLIIVNLYVDLQYHFSTFLLSLETRIVAVPYFGTLTHIPPPAGWVPGVTQPISSLLLYTTNFILPAILVYRLNRPFIQTLKSCLPGSGVLSCDADTL